MRRFIRPKLLVLVVVVMLLSAVLTSVISPVSAQSTHAVASNKVSIPSMKLPWDKSVTTIPLTGGPFGNIPDKTCTLEHLPIMSGVDFGLPQNTDVLAVAAGKVIYAGYTNNNIRNEVRIDHGGGFVTEYWGLNSINSSIVVGASIAQGKLLGLSGYTPCPKCKNGISVHLRLEFRQYTSNPLVTTPLSAQKMPIDGYTIWAFLNAPTNQGYNFQGTMTTGVTIVKYQTECGVNGVKTWYSRNGPTVVAVPNGTGGFLTSTNIEQQVLTDWPTFGFDTQNTRFNSYENMLTSTNVSGLVLDWSYATGGGIISSPSVVNGIVYVGSDDHKLYAFNATTGAFLWSYMTGGDVRSSPAVTNGVVYIGSVDDKLYALNATTGKLLWSSTTGLFIESPPLVVNGMVYVGSDDHRLYAFNATTGAFLWSYLTGSDIGFSAPAVSQGVVYIGSEDFTLYALNATTGAFLWSYTAGDEMYSSPSVANGVVYVASKDFKLYALNATTGAFLWSYATNGPLTSSPAFANGVVYLGSQDNKEYALNASTGMLLWSYTTGNSIGLSSSTVANGVVYIGSDDQKLYALDATTGNLLWSYTTGNLVYSSPSVVNGMVYVGSDDNTLYAFHLSSITS